MNDEIKEIIELIKNNYKNYYTDDYITGEDLIKLVNYITNLQEENQILKENAIHNDKVVDKARWNENIYKSRFDKVIELIEPFIDWGECTINGKILKQIADILKGDD